MDLEFHQLDLCYEGLRVRQPAREGRLLASLEQRGQQVPIVVVAVPEEEGRYRVIDGHKRIRALRRLGEDTVQATVWELPEAEALLLGRTLRTQPGESILEQGWLLCELSRLGWSPEELARRFDRSVSWVSRRLSLTRALPPEVQERVRRGEIPAQAAMKSLVPMARTDRQACEQLSRAIAEKHLTSREIARLYAAWRQASPAVRQRLLEDPCLFLRSREELKSKAPQHPAEAFVQDLERLAALARRSERQWPEIASELSAAEGDRVARCLRQALSDLKRLSQQIVPETPGVDSLASTESTADDEEETDADTPATHRHPAAAQEEDRPPRDRPPAEDLPRCGQESDPLTQRRAAQDSQTPQGARVSPGDPRAVPAMSRQPGAGARGASGPGGGDLLPRADGVLPPAWGSDQSRESRRVATTSSRVRRSSTTPPRIGSRSAVEKRKVQTAAAILCFSRMLFCQCYPRFRRFECKVFLTEALQYFGGVAQRVMIDNTHVVVLRGTGAEMIPVPEMEAFAERFGFRFLAHEKGDANRSAHVERAFWYIETNFLAGRTFTDWNDLNQQARHWCDQSNGRYRRHLKARPVELYAVERIHLRPLPLWIPEPYQILHRTVDVEGYVTDDTNRYSVPSDWIGRPVQVRKTQDRLEIETGREPTVVHPRVIEPCNKRSTLPEHRPPRGQGKKRQKGSREEKALQQEGPGAERATSRS